MKSVRSESSESESESSAQISTENIPGGLESRVRGCRSCKTLLLTLPSSSLDSLGGNRKDIEDTQGGGLKKLGVFEGLV